MHTEQGFFHDSGKAGCDAGQGKVVPDFIPRDGVVDEVRRSLGQVAIDESLSVVARPIKGTDGIEDPHPNTVASGRVCAVCCQILPRFRIPAVEFL